MQIKALGLYALLAGAPCLSAAADAAPGANALIHTVVRFSCDAKAVALGLPSGPFTVSYHGVPDKPGIVILPVRGKDVGLPSAVSADGAKYADANLVWWNRGKTAMAYASEATRETGTSNCHQID